MQFRTFNRSKSAPKAAARFLSGEVLAAIMYTNKSEKTSPKLLLSPCPDGEKEYGSGQVMLSTHQVGTLLHRIDEAAAAGKPVDLVKELRDFYAAAAVKEAGKPAAGNAPAVVARGFYIDTREVLEGLAVGPFDSLTALKGWKEENDMVGDTILPTNPAYADCVANGIVPADAAAYLADAK